MKLADQDQKIVDIILKLSRDTNLNILGGRVRRSSSRFCLGVEHGDYNGTELFGVGTDRFIWLGYKANESGKVRLFSGNFPEEGVIEFNLGGVPGPQSAEMVNSWGRFPLGVDYILRREGYKLSKGMDAVIYGNIPGGGMSRSASLTLNLILTLLEINKIEIADPFKMVEMAQAVENDYIGAPCGPLDQIMILLARENMGTHYNPRTRSINYVPLGKGSADFSIVILDTGTERPGLEKSTYKVRRAECEQFVRLIQQAGFAIDCLADVKDDELYEKIMTRFKDSHPNHCDRLKYIFSAQRRFYQMLKAWKAGDIKTVGEIFRADGIGLRDDYRISGPELEAMCDIARSVPGVLGERMLGGGDKGASGALVRTEKVAELKAAIEAQYPQRYPELKDEFDVQVCKIVDGMKVFNGVLK